MADRQTWTYKGIDRVTAKNVSGTVQASSEAEAIDAATREGVVPLSVKRTAATNTKSQSASGAGKRARSRDVNLFIRGYTTAASSNMRTEDALQIGLTGLHSPGLRWAVNDIIDMYSNGVPLHEAFAVHSAMFGAETAAVMEAGEASGNTNQALKALADSKEHTRRIRGKIITAMVYPMAIAVAAALALVVIIIEVLPRVEEIITSIGGTPPLVTQILLSFAAVIENHGVVMLITVVMSALAAKVALNSEKARYTKSAIAMYMPLVGPIVRGLNSSTLCELCGVMLSAGVTQVRTMELVSAAIRNRVVSTELERIQQRVIDGMELDAACKISVPKIDPVVPALAQQTVSGISDPGEPWHKYGSAVAEETDRRADVLKAAIEPLLIVMVGLLIMVMALAVYMPMLSIYGHLQNLQ